jgi:uncharacterized protein (DUF2147 family)
VGERRRQCKGSHCVLWIGYLPGTPKEKKGDKLVMSIKRGADGVYSGTAFDPQRDMSYKLTVTVNGDKMTTRGCIVAGLLCKAIDWTRIN